jgi:hypothetical protein
VLLTREEQTYDFGGARFDLDRDREALSWIFSQFLFGEVTGVQVGEWLAQAPDFDSARFLARQANEEMAHVQLFLRILRSLGAEPQPPHRALKFLATDFAGGTFLEHCCLEMALGEGLVLMAIYALIDTLPESEVRNLLVGLSRQEEGHVSFGEDQTMRGLARNRSQARHLLGLALVSLAAVRRLAGWVGPGEGTGGTRCSHRCRLSCGPRPPRSSSGSGAWACSGSRCPRSPPVSEPR